MNNIFYTYLLIDSRTNLPFYVGKGKNNRMYLHVRQTLKGKLVNGNLHKYNKIKQIYRYGGKVIHKKFVKNVSNEIAIKLEILLIKYYGRQNLCNLTDGGEGLNGISDETKKRMSKNHFLNNGGIHPMLGRKHSIKTKEKMSISHKGIEFSEDHKNNLSIAGIGKKHSEETKRKIAYANSIRIVTEETKRKISNSLKGRVAWNKGINYATT